MRIETINRKFWSQFLDARKLADFRLFSGVSPGDKYWLSTGAGLSHVGYGVTILRNEIHVGFGLTSASKEENKVSFDYLYSRKDVIEATFGAPLNWLRRSDRQQSYIRFSKPVDAYDERSWPEMIRWLMIHVQRLERAFKPEIDNLRRVKGSLTLSAGREDSRRE